jgi:GNAT superfamily N-acetyltransferase
MPGPSILVRVLVRRMAETDIAAVVAACDWLFAAPGATPERWDPDACGARLRAMLSADDAACFVAAQEEVVVGFVTVYLDLVSTRRGQRSWINELAVDPNTRSRGIGKRLLDTAIDWARERGATHVAVDSSLARVDAHRFYVRQQPDWQAHVFGWDL